MVLLLLALVRNDLLKDWQASLPANAPNYFMINIRPDEGAAVTGFFAESGLPVTELVPLVRARLTAINDKPLAQIKFVSDRANGFAEREANLTWSRKLTEGNKIVAGKWWDENAPAGPPRVLGRNGVRRDAGSAARRRGDL
jgi:putative ABC transport system permease protein